MWTEANDMLMLNDIEIKTNLGIRAEGASTYSAIALPVTYV